MPFELLSTIFEHNLTNLRNDMYTFKELIDIRGGIKECNGFTKTEISRLFWIFVPVSYIMILKYQG